jgi:hypothetical protein
MELAIRVPIHTSVSINNGRLIAISMELAMLIPPLGSI